MLESNCETTLVSQLLHSINGHLKTIHLPMEYEEPPDYELSLDNIGATTTDDDDELWLSGHRSIFSLYGSHCRKTILPLHDSQYEDFHWDCYGNQTYHHLAFESDQRQFCQPTSVAEWSMNLNSDGTEDDVDDTTSSSDRPRTSWQAIKSQSINQSDSSIHISDSDHYSPNPLTLYRLFQRTKSHQHPCHLYQNFSDKSQCDSLTSSSSSSSNSPQIPMSKITFQNSTDSISLSNSKQQLKNHVDQCLQTSIILPSIARLKPTDHPSQSSLTSQPQLPDLDFLRYYAKENPPQLTTSINQTKPFCTAMKSTLSEPLSLTKKPIHTVFYCSVKLPNQSLTPHPPLSTCQKSSNKHIKTSLTTSSDCSSTSSSGYFSHSSPYQIRHIQTPLKSCLKRTKTDELTKANVLAVGMAGDVFTLATGLLHNNDQGSNERHFSAPTTSSHQQTIPLQFQPRNLTCTLSEHDLRAKKSVSFCDEITRWFITPSTSPKHQYQDYCDLVPRESLTDSPPSEFNLTDDDDEDDYLLNFIENTSPDIIKPLPIRHTNDRPIIDAFANTILRILEIKCNDPQSYYLNNQTNHELDRILRLELCSLLREILEDGMRPQSTSLFSRKINLWRLIDLTTSTTSRFNEAKRRVQIELSSNNDWIERFNSFIYHLLNLHELTAWLTHFISQHTLLSTYYESWAFVLVNLNSDLLECITNQLEKLSPLPFRLKYTNLTNSRVLLTNSRLSTTSILPKKFNVRTWLRDRKPQVKISPKESISVVLSNSSNRQKANAILSSFKRS